MMQRAADRPEPDLAARLREVRRTTTERGDVFERLVIDLVRSVPDVRTEIVDAARARLAEGSRPSALDLADLLVDELAGARLR
jgi:hypothetical protein